MKKVWGSYYSAFKFALLQWKMWTLIYLFNLAYCFLAVYPIRSWLNASFAGSTNLSRLSDVFDLNILMDLLHANDSVMALVMPLVLIAMVLYFLWISFFVGGVLHTYKHRSFNLGEFLGASGKYFFQNLRLSIYMVLFYVLLVILAYLYFAKDGLNVLKMEEEQSLIFRFQVLTTIIFTIAFFAGILKEIVRVRIVKRQLLWFNSAIIHAFKNMFKPDYLILGFFNLIALVLVVVLHYLIVRSPWLNGHIILMVVLSQSLLIFRMILKLTRLGSFYEMSDVEDF